MASRVIKCARCGSETPATGPRTQYCPSCAYIIRLEKQNARRSNGRKHAEHTKIITCEICGKEIVVNSKAARAKYCPECATKAFKASTKKMRDKEKNTIVCERCGTEFVSTNIRGPQRKYCDECKESAYKETNRKAFHAWAERRKNGLPNMKICDICGAPFDNKGGGGRRYCDKCRIEVKREAERQKQRKKREGWRCTDLQQKRKKPRVSQIDSIQRAAHEAGMSYGKYQALLAVQKMQKAKQKKNSRKKGA